MKGFQVTRQQVILGLGDALTLLLVTVAGFARHDELGTAGLRLLTTFIPLAAAWYLVAPHLGVFRAGQVDDVKQLWRPFWAMILAAPLAAWLRAVWLGTSILPVFVAVIGGISALSLVVWRAVFLVAAGNKRVAHG